MILIRIKVDPNDPSTHTKGRIDYAKVDAITEQDIARHEKKDEAEALQEMARVYTPVALPDEFQQEGVCSTSPDFSQYRQTMGRRQAFPEQDILFLFPYSEQGNR
ncbi:MAG: hypothetical protein OXC57_10565 [Rhodobacteraceae bacterium]|nr:hypothetical protein [Paracoccaceae bacterium]